MLGQPFQGVPHGPFLQQLGLHLLGPHEGLAVEEGRGFGLGLGPGEVLGATGGGLGGLLLRRSGFHRGGGGRYGLHDRSGHRCRCRVGHHDAAARPWMAGRGGGVAKRCGG